MKFRSLPGCFCPRRRLLFNIDNVSDAAAFYGSFRNWTDAHQLKWDHMAWISNPISASWNPSLQTLLNRLPPLSGIPAQSPLPQAVSRIRIGGSHSFGWLSVETSQFP